MAKTDIEKTDEQWREWTLEHQVSYEVRPLLQMQGKKVAQVGFEFEFAARWPGAGVAVGSRDEVNRAVLTGLAELAGQVFPVEGEIARFELAPFQPVVQLRSGSDPELRRAVKVYYKDDASRTVAEGDRQRLGKYDRRLKELGVKAGSWGQKR